VRKYAEVIGLATEKIARGQHVHVHNVEGLKGRGDQA
jgi:altronate dehydratase small subunit